MSSQCPRCGIWGGATAAHECLPHNYVELPPLSSTEQVERRKSRFELNEEARQVGIEWARKQEQERTAREQAAEKKKLDADLAAFNARYGFNE